ncbi:hypothetical protein JOE25_000542 [Serratia sp. PL17]|nr:hypothetical protein [Serratia sp. PL17]
MGGTVLGVRDFLDSTCGGCRVSDAGMTDIIDRVMLDKNIEPI